MNKFSRKLLIVTLLVSSHVAVKPLAQSQTIWGNLGFWFTAAHQHNITTGLIEVIQHIVDVGGCTSIINDVEAKAYAQELFTYMKVQPGFETVRAVQVVDLDINDMKKHSIKRSVSQDTLVSLRLHAIQHFCPDLNFPENPSSWNGTTVEDAAAWLLVNQELNVASAIPYIKASLILVVSGY